MSKEGYFKAKATVLEDGSNVNIAQGTKGYSAYARFAIVDGEEAGATVPWFGSFNGGAADYTIKGLRAMGFQGDDLSTVGTQKLDAEVQIKVELNDYGGRQSYKVSFVSPLSSGGIKLENRLSGPALSMFAASMKEKLRAVPSIARPAQTAKPVPEREPGCDDDIPL